MHGLGVPVTTAIGDALYVGLVTDTGRFMYENTGPRAHEMAAELIAGGVDAARDLPAPLRGHPAGQARAAGARADQRRALRRRPADRHAPHPRRLPLRGRRRELLRGRRRPPALGRGHRRRRRSCATSSTVSRPRKVSLRATDDRIDVSVIARALGGGGHRRAAGLSTDLEFAELVKFLREQLARAALNDGVLLVDKPAGRDVARRRRQDPARAGQGREGRARGDAGPVRDRAADRRRRARDARSSAS